MEQEKIENKIMEIKSIEKLLQSVYSAEEFYKQLDNIKECGLQIKLTNSELITIELSLGGFSKDPVLIVNKEICCKVINSINNILQDYKVIAYSQSEDILKKINK